MLLFREEGYQVIVDPEIKIIREFKTIWTRDKDRKKRGAFNEFAYIYHMHDYKSPYSIYSEKEREGRILKELGFKPDYKPDGVLKKACDKYIELQQTPAIKSLTAIKEGLLSSAHVINSLRVKIDEALEQEENDDEEAPDITSIVRSVTQLLDLSEKIPKAIDTITALESKVKKEQSNETRIKGGGTKGMFED